MIEPPATMVDANQQRSVPSALGLELRQATGTCGDGAATSNRFFKCSTAILCAVGLFVLLAGYGYAMAPNDQREAREKNPPAELRMLQPLVTGNLAVFLLWVWLDLRAPRRDEKDGEARFGLWFLAAAVAGVTTLGGAAWAGMLEHEPFLPFLLCIVAPVLVTVVPLLWFAARRIHAPWLRALFLAGVVAASAMVQHGHKTGNDAELRVFTMNSCLIGLAAAVWLLTWAATPEPRGTT